MHPPTQASAPPSEPPRGRKQRVVRRVAVLLVLAAIALASGFAFIASDAALRLAAQVLVGRSDGRLEVLEPAGSLLSTVRAKRLAWRGPEATLIADDVALNWNPMALWSHGIVVKGLGAQHIAFATQGSNSATTLPAGLALPTNVTIDEVAVAHFDWRIGTNSGTITGLTFGYAGGAASHRVERLSLVAPRGTLTGRMALDARPPFAATGAFAFAGDVADKPARADVSVAGTLDALAIEATGRAGDAQFTLRARLTPLAAAALGELSLDARNLDAAAWDPALPATRASIKAEAHSVDGGLAGRFETTNAIDGPIDAGRLPVRSVSARFAWRANELAIDDLVAEISGRGRASGKARIPLSGVAGKWALEVRDVDLRQIYAPLASTRISGTLGADLAAARQTFDGRVADRSIVGGIDASFAATLSDRVLQVERFEVRAGDGGITGSGHVDLAGQRAFDVVAKAKRMDPSRFGRFPVGSLGGELTARGNLDPAWRVGIELTVGAGSRLAGVPLAGRARATLAARAVRDAEIDLTLASARLTASGSAGEGDDALSVALDVPRIADLAALLPPRVPHPLSGTLVARASLRGDVESGSLEFKARGDALKIGAALSIGTVDAQVTIGRAAGAGQQSGERRLDVDWSATAVATRPATFAQVRARVHGTLAQHVASLAFTGEDLDLDASAHGGISESRGADGARAWAWTGSIDALENRGPWAVRLEAPATLEIARDRVRAGAAHLDVAGGRVDLASLAWDDGHVSTRGAFAGVPVATLARLSGVNLPFVSTLTLAGDWSLAATPRLNGSATVRRERGDLFVGPDAVLDHDKRALHVTEVNLSLHVRDDAVDATAVFRSERGPDAQAQLTIGVAPGAPPGHLAADAPLQLALMAELPTLNALQPWVGTTAVIDGNARVELTARGTVADAPLSGTVRATGVRIAAPQYGLHFTDGRLAARLTDGVLVLDELSLAAGAGRFTATGTLATNDTARGDGQGTATQVTWNANKFRLFNRPDLRLVLSGSGVLALKDRKIALEGALAVDEGHIEYRAETGSDLGDDVVVKGWPARTADATRRDRPPLSLDLELDLGRDLTFRGEGLETGLRGKVRVATAADGSIRGRGTIRAVNGTYYAFGQSLAIDRGRLIFDGPLDNPGLDIVALRKNLAVEAGVTVSGTVKVPIVQLTSNPPVPDNEKLSWLVLGQGLDRTSGSDIAALQVASAALLGRGGKSVTSTVAESVGLDEISVGRSAGVPRGAGRSGGDVSGQVVVFGKRITDKLSLVYEQGLTVATNALRLEYSLSRTLTLRVEAGAISGFGVYYRRVFD